nr:GIY-YIG nuclease family protein [Kaumoebavirus]QQV29762.1 GIY-YIG nuclease family protein [Kaumoebavirus]
MYKKYLYVLALADDCYYVGITNNLKRRITQHKKGASGWTTLHKPSHIIEHAENVRPCVENKVTLNYIDRYGWEKVRGGSFLSIDIKNPLKEVDALRKKYAIIVEPELVPGMPNWKTTKDVDTTPVDPDVERLLLELAESYNSGTKICIESS